MGVPLCHPAQPHAPQPEKVTVSLPTVAPLASQNATRAPWATFSLALLAKWPPKAPTRTANVNSAVPRAVPKYGAPANGFVRQSRSQLEVIKLPLPPTVHRSAVLLKTRPVVHGVKTTDPCVSNPSVYGPVNGPTGVICAQADPAPAHKPAAAVNANIE